MSTALKITPYRDTGPADLANNPAIELRARHVGHELKRSPIRVRLPDNQSLYRIVCTDDNGQDQLIEGGYVEVVAALAFWGYTIPTNNPPADYRGK